MSSISFNSGTYPGAGYRSRNVMNQYREDSNSDNTSIEFDELNSSASSSIAQSIPRDETSPFFDWEISSISTSPPLESFDRPNTTSENSPYTTRDTTPYSHLSDDTSNHVDLLNSRLSTVRVETLTEEQQSVDSLNSLQVFLNQLETDLNNDFQNHRGLDPSFLKKYINKLTNFDYFIKYSLDEDSYNEFLNYSNRIHQQIKKIHADLLLESNQRFQEVSRLLEK